MAQRLALCIEKSLDQPPKICSIWASISRRATFFYAEGALAAAKGRELGVRVGLASGALVEVPEE